MPRPLERPDRNLAADFTTMIINNRSRRRRPDPLGRVSARNLIYDRGFRNRDRALTHRVREGHPSDCRLISRNEIMAHSSNDPGNVFENYSDWPSSSLTASQGVAFAVAGPSRAVNLVDNQNYLNRNQLGINSLGQEGQGQEGQVQGINQNTNQPVQIDPPRARLTFWDHIRMIGARNYFIPPKKPRSRRCINRYKKAGFYISMISTVTCLFLFWNALVHPFPMIGRQLFIADKFKQMFLTDEDYYPIIAMLVIFYTMVLGGFAVHYTHKPEFDAGFYMYLYSARCLILVGFPILVWYTWTHSSFYPDKNYTKHLEDTMWSNLKVARVIRKTNGVTIGPTPFPLKIWDDTQTTFKCCGINSYEDWFPRRLKNIGYGNVNKFDFAKYVPKSCCKKEQSDHSIFDSDLEFQLCETFYVYKKGCLQSQLEALTKEVNWVVNPGLFFATFSHLAFYIILGRIFSNTVARTRTARPFELEQTPANNPVPNPIPIPVPV